MAYCSTKCSVGRGGLWPAAVPNVPWVGVGLWPTAVPNVPWVGVGLWPTAVPNVPWVGVDYGLLQYQMFRG